MIITTAHQLCMPLQRKADQLEGLYKALKGQYETLSNEISIIKAEIDILTKVSAVLKHLLDLLVKDEINNMAGLITYGLKSVFDNQDLVFVPIITKKNEKIHIELKISNRGIEGEFGSFGGSVAVIEGFLLRVLCILKKKYARVMLLDETFVPVGEEYIANTSKLISELSKKLGLDVLLVTHNRSFQNMADHVYRISDTLNNDLEMEKLR